MKTIKALTLALLLALIGTIRPSFADYANTAMQTAAVATGNGVPAPTAGAISGEMMKITGITTATITFEATCDDTNWDSVQATNTATGAVATTATANGTYFVPAAGYTQVRARISAWSSGAITILGRATTAPVGSVQSSADGAGPVTQSGAWNVGVSNTTSTLLASTVVATPTSTSATAVTGLGIYKQVMILLNVTAAANAIDDTLDVYIDTSPDGGTTWLNVVHYPQVLGNDGAKKFTATLDPAGAAGTACVAVTSDAAANTVRPSIFTDRLRVRYVTVDGIIPGASTFTFVVTAFGKS